MDGVITGASGPGLPDEEQPPVGERFTMSVSRNGSTAVITLAGELDQDTAAELREAWEDAVEAGATRLVVDCGRLQFCDSIGLNVLLGARLVARSLGGSVHLVAPQPPVARMLEVTGASTVFPVHATLEEAAPG